MQITATGEVIDMPLHLVCGKPTNYHVPCQEKTESIEVPLDCWIYLTPLARRPPRSTTKPPNHLESPTPSPGMCDCTGHHQQYHSLQGLRRHCICHCPVLVLRRHATRLRGNEWRAEARTKQKEDNSKNSRFSEDNQKPAFFVFSSLCTAAMDMMMMECSAVPAENDDTIAAESLTCFGGGSEAPGRGL